MLRKQLLGKQLLRKKLPRRQLLKGQQLRRKLLRRKLLRRRLREPALAAVEVSSRPRLVGAVTSCSLLMTRAIFRSTNVPSLPLSDQDLLLQWFSRNL